MEEKLTKAEQQVVSDEQEASDREARRQAMIDREAAYVLIHAGLTRHEEVTTVIEQAAIRAAKEPDAPSAHLTFTQELRGWLKRNFG